MQRHIIGVQGNMWTEYIGNHFSILKNAGYTYSRVIEGITGNTFLK